MESNGVNRRSEREMKGIKEGEGVKGKFSDNCVLRTDNSP